ncbi:MAG: metallophosphoesterase [Planctomycetaceae bacterium]|jgi:predicted MPP superfamily phosphohydrolase|nr:metallophosphoesterase [Planctomycetaceae bacterium]
MYPSKNTTNDRRRFLGLLTVSGLGLTAVPALQAQENSVIERPLVDSPPVLQCPSETGITVVWAVGKPATGWVQFGTDQEKLDQTAFGEENGLLPYHDRFLQIRLSALKPNTQYFYQTATASFKYVNAYKFERGEPEFSSVYSFTTSGAGKENGSFSVINDTHENQKTLKLLTERLALLGSDYTVWNGDLVNSVENADQIVKAILRPAHSPFAAEHPLLFVPGNHDYRGNWSRNLELALPRWELNDLRDRETSRNFAVRTGSLALIGLDTGEDKPDQHPAWAGLAKFEPYRVAQRDWLERALNKPEIASAPFIVAFCHIPIFSSNPKANGGNVLEGFASFQRQAGNLWGPILTKHGVQLVVCAHQHRFHFDPATPERTWAQVVGGGHNDKEQVTVIHGHTNSGKLELIVDELRSGNELGRWTFEKRTT